jgi:uncharacterized membrane protein
MPRLLRPLTLSGVSLGAFVVLLVAGLAARHPDCRPGPDWFQWLMWIVGLIGVVAAFTAAYNFGMRSRSATAGIGAFVLAVVWVVVATAVLFVLTFPSGCLS